MAHISDSFSAIVLAGERPGGSAFSRELGLPASVLVDVAGQSALARVISAVESSTSINAGLLCGPSEDVFRENIEFQNIIDGTSFTWMAPAPGPSASALAAIDRLQRYPILLTAGDHALLSPALVDDFCTRAKLLDADIVVGLAPYDIVRAAFPESKRTVLKFSDGQYCGTNLFAILSPAGRAGPDFWQQVEADRKRPWRIAWRLGPGLLLRLLFGRVNLQQALDSLSSVIGCRVACIFVDEPRAAVDVDSVADRDLAESILIADGQSAG